MVDLYRDLSSSVEQGLETADGAAVAAPPVTQA